MAQVRSWKQMLSEHHLAVSLQKRSGGRMIRAAFIEVVEVYVVLGLAQSRLLFCGYSFLLTGPKGSPWSHTNGLCCVRF